ncbi:WecB/TagA/CpsF family glycosyltransferase [Shewanella sp. UCD-KL12]|uniref:WecB/TagA/CpsF family glycosyltransferase n=1 Tax=Shewanella sp. UCD-KL12 TaxID=1917163 RepID=UPI0009FAA2A3|nr:WecB/TagA/CpsF family glycosyltransferase [Shewanella sp. UCD-KL12]
METNEILGCPINLVDSDMAREHINSFVESKRFGYFVAINAEKIYRYRKDEQLKSVVDASLYPYPDGAGAVISGRLFFGMKSEKINMPILALEEANANGWRVFIYGAQEDVHNDAIGKIKIKYPNIQIVGNMHGYHSQESAMESIAQSKPQLVMLALGSPRQEFFANKCTVAGLESIFIGCGGALDIISGRLNRAPSFFVDNGLEWFYRLVQEPWRWKRQRVLPLFLFAIMKEKLFKTKSK